MRIEPMCNKNNNELPIDIAQTLVRTDNSWGVRVVEGGNNHSSPVLVNSFSAFLGCETSFADEGLDDGSLGVNLLLAGQESSQISNSCQASFTVNLGFQNYILNCFS
jgi:hypothetical protein